MIVTRYVCNNSNELPRNLQATIGRIISGINTIFLSCGKYTRELNSLLILPRINCDVTSSRSIVRLDRHPPLIFHRLLFTRNSDPRRGRAGIRAAITADLSIRNENSRLHRYASTRFHNERALASHFARFQHFSTESRKGEFFATRATFP